MLLRTMVSPKFWKQLFSAQVTVRMQGKDEVNVHGRYIFHIIWDTLVDMLLLFIDNSRVTHNNMCETHTLQLFFGLSGPATYRKG